MTNRYDGSIQSIEHGRDGRNRMTRVAGASLRNIVTAALVLLFASSGRSETIVMKVYNAEGEKLSYEQFFDVISGKEYGGKYELDMFLNAGDYTVAQGWPMSKQGGNPAFELKYGPVVLSVPWVMESTGYSTLVLDNGGAGFTQSGTYVFNLVAAVDCRRKLSTGPQK
jgi:hypothetical protein